MLENTIPITELALGIGEDTLFEGLDIEGIDAINDILGFYAIGADVLHGRCTYFTRDEAEFLQTAVPHIGQLSNHIVEPQAVLGFYGVVIEELRPRHTRMEDDSVKVLREKEVRALAYMEDGLSFMLTEHLTQLVQRVVLNEQLRFDIDTEGVIWQQ